MQVNLPCIHTWGACSWFPRHLGSAQSSKKIWAGKNGDNMVVWRYFPLERTCVIFLTRVLQKTGTIIPPAAVCFGLLSAGFSMGSLREDCFLVFSFLCHILHTYLHINSSFQRFFFHHQFFGEDRSDQICRVDGDFPLNKSTKGIHQQSSHEPASYPKLCGLDKLGEQ